jgi:putative ATP-dependent endonuclease of OLD family
LLETTAKTDDDLLLHMRANKTETALTIFGSKTAITYPDYILQAIAP